MCPLSLSVKNKQNIQCVQKFSVFNMTQHRSKTFSLKQKCALDQYFGFRYADKESKDFKLTNSINYLSAVFMQFFPLIASSVFNKIRQKQCLYGWFSTINTVSSVSWNCFFCLLKPKAFAQFLCKYEALPRIFGPINSTSNKWKNVPTHHFLLHATYLLIDLFVLDLGRQKDRTSHQGQSRFPWKLQWNNFFEPDT